VAFAAAPLRDMQAENRRREAEQKLKLLNMQQVWRQSDTAAADTAGTALQLCCSPMTQPQALADSLLDPLADAGQHC